jgi:beta-N-acetylhexosaminidase
MLAGCSSGSSTTSAAAPPATPPTGLPPPTSSEPPPPSPPPVPLGRLVGQRLIVAFNGTTAPADLLAQLRTGAIGGVVLFGRNISTPDQVRALTARLAVAAHVGGAPPPLVCVDQEGGGVKRLPWAPPDLSPPQLGALPVASSRRQGLLTGRELRALGINCDLAPVADVPTVPGSFIAAQGRAFSSDPAVAAPRVAAFAQGLEAAGVAATLKHFPGLGFARATTDRNLVTIRVPRGALAPGLMPFQSGIAAGADMVMLSSATYTTLSRQPGAWSMPIIDGLLRSDLGFSGVIITDSLDSAAGLRGWTTPQAAVRSAAAGADLLLITGSAATSRGTFVTLVEAARGGTLPRTELEQGYARILALKRRLR